jgi:DNA-directed RNA polymerase specialized sigma24 family protein
MNNILDQKRKEVLEGKLDASLFFEQLVHHILDNPALFNLTKIPSEERLDFLGGIYPTLCKTLERYQEQDSSFDAYIHQTVSWCVHKYCKDKRYNTIIDKVHLDISINEYQEFDQEQQEFNSEYDSSFSDEFLSRYHEYKPSPRQTLFLILRYYAFVSDKLIKQVADFIGMKVDKLQDMLSKIRDERFEADQKIKFLREHIIQTKYRILFIKRCLQLSSESYFCQKHELKLKRTQERLASLQRRQAVQRKTASNKLIAKIMNCSKGNVDSVLYNFRQKVKKISQRPKSKDLGFSAGHEKA